MLVKKKLKECIKRKIIEYLNNFIPLFFGSFTSITCAFCANTFSSVNTSKNLIPNLQNKKSRGKREKDGSIELDINLKKEASVIRNILDRLGVMKVMLK